MTAKQKTPLKMLKRGTSMALDKHRRMVREMPAQIEKRIGILLREMKFSTQRKPTMQGLNEIESKRICIECLLVYNLWLLDITLVLSIKRSIILQTKLLIINDSRRQGRS